jgi:uncharacterized membrane protein
MDTNALIDAIGRGIELVGISVIVIGAALATLTFVLGLVGGGAFEAMYRTYRQGLGRAILLGLEFLVAADIIRTVAISPTIESALALGIIVVVRTVLSVSLQVEVDGTLPWRRAAASSTPTGS